MEVLSCMPNVCSIRYTVWWNLGQRKFRIITEKPYRSPVLYDIISCIMLIGSLNLYTCIYIYVQYISVLPAVAAVALDFHLQVQGDDVQK